MATTLGFKNLLDVPEWRSMANAPNASAAGVSLAWDEQLTDPCPYIFQLASNTIVNVYNPYNDEWLPLISPALTTTFGVGAAAVFMPHYGPAGTLGASSGASDIVISSALGTAITANQWANQGNGLGFTVRVIGNSGGGAGKTEERRVVRNTSGTTPTLYLDNPLSWTPAAGDTYELLSGRVYFLGALTVAASSWRYYDIALGTMNSGATANLPASITTDSDMIAMSEAHTPFDRSSNEGFFGILTATGSAAGTLTGQAAGGDAVVATNEYRNFAIRIVEDVATPTAVGQRRNITSHTAGASPVYTLASNWTVTPSATAKYVIENDRDKILLWTSASASTFTYSIGGNAWSTATFAARPAVIAAGVCAVHGYGIEPDAQRLVRHSYIYSPRGTTNVIDRFDIAGAATGSWGAGDIAYGNKGLTAFALGTSMAIDPWSNSGKYAYINVAGTQRFARLDMQTLHMEPWSWLHYTQGAAVAGKKLALVPFVDGATRLPLLMALRNTGAEMFQVAISR